MTSLPEAKLAREAELCYDSVCFVTDYDSWHETEHDVTAAIVVERMAQNTAHGAAIISGVVQSIPAACSCTCGQALASAFLTNREVVPTETRRRLASLLKPYWWPTP